MPGTWGENLGRPARAVSRRVAGGVGVGAWVHKDLSASEGLEMGGAWKLQSSKEAVGGHPEKRREAWREGAGDMATGGTGLRKGLRRMCLCPG